MKTSAFLFGETRSEKREARSEKREARSEKREARSEFSMKFIYLASSDSQSIAEQYARNSRYKNTASRAVFFIHQYSKSLVSEQGDKSIHTKYAEY
ncbi:hypothetical protein VII00023_05867 [Vibrio ichthyoenteri ATCC 700023]|uniref:Uncharacterized protein n=1 Tax=Vibrio ichthyoenteri ATCC 700023 TaxID=870968 RepID=F9S905_9VIBR|nr:hypothetical protein VII00023_05867 [Vibrio ichthyoenteri ATCC 700023]